MMLSAQAKIEEEEMLEWATFDNAALATEALAKVLGEEHPSNDSLPARARASLASWLITLTRIPSSTYTLLSEYVGDVFDPNDPQRVTATKVLFYALEEDMGMAPKWLSSLSEFDEDGFANSTIQLLGRPAAEIRKTAEATYTRLFGRPVPPIVRTKR